MRSRTVLPSSAARRILPGVRAFIVGGSLVLTSGCTGSGQGVRPIPTPPAPHLLTVAERSDFRATARHAEVVQLLDDLAAASPLARRGSMGTTTEGRDIPLLIVADPALGTAAEARGVAAREGKLIVLLFGNIHAGEVDGKEALPMLAREILSAARPALLRDLIIVFAPIYNADGNERVSKDNRPGQTGPEEGMGIRENANGRDLNRDFVKVEEAETRAMLRFLNEWDPAVVVDCHTTNGSYHRYVLTYAGPKVPAGDPAIIEYSRERMLPAIDAAFERATGWNSSWYGTFSYGADPRGEPTGWETFPAEPRFATNMIGLRNRLSVLSEGYTYAPYRDRVMGTKAFCREVLEFAAANRRAIRSLLRGADRRARQAEGRSVALRTEVAAFGEQIQILGYEEEWNSERRVRKDAHRTYTVDLLDRWRSVREATVPTSYIIEARAVSPKLREALSLHGIAISELAAPLVVPAESYRVVSIKQASRMFQGHVLATYDVERERGPRTFEPGSIRIDTAGQNGPLITYLLEPESEDGLTVWNYFDCCTRVGEEFPVHRLPG